MDERDLFQDPRTILKRHGLFPKKSFGQNFLVSPRAVLAIGRACVDEIGREVIEIGPGVGTLTHALLGLGAHVTAIEQDRDMCALLRAEYPDSTTLELLETDAAAFDYAAAVAQRPRVIAGNLPYHITGLILRQLLGLRQGLLRAVLMVQKEVADRLLAPPSTKDRGALSVLAQARFHVTKLQSVPPGAFHPPPKVHSAVVRLVPLPEPMHVPLPFSAFEAAVHAAFSARRKTLRNALVIAGIGAPQECVALLERCSIDPSRRAESLDLDDFVRLAFALFLPS
ncbi:MAG: 16S rRNA (adenine(1518)-N(6)/adenine(1519)-N(6))-dimethyltransferase RsmA [Myxococcota bacterium]|jgi:16S rRNA (adenine1518-N6/adenine1519-N6)-dimethyltransferase|nr:16S rRNA (adenine(1518)-N(6)/adenine(1519)-N(6))-dimethyltransferase RsmA [Myxococcota bacterium]